MGIEISESRTATVGAIPVRRALPQRRRRTVGAWCFADHMGPAPVTPEHGLAIGPHPHCGLHTVTWLIEGEVLHHDSLGTEQLIAPGQLNLMTAGRGVSHSEEGTGSYAGPVQGIQLWVAQPEAARHGDPGFEHHASLPALELPGATATVLVGELDGVASLARHDTPIVGAELRVHDVATLPLAPAFEYALVVLEGGVVVDDALLEPGRVGYLQPGRDELRLAPTGPTTAMLLGGEPFPDEVVMWWNYVARSRDEVAAAHRSWLDDDGRFGTVESSLQRVEVDLPPWA